jgi:hypothetical protein
MKKRNQRSPEAQAALQSRHRIDKGRVTIWPPRHEKLARARELRAQRCTEKAAA